MEKRSNKFALRFLKITTPIFKILFRVKFTGTENVPEGSQFIFAANHISILDPFYIAIGSKKEMNFLAKSELFENKFLAAFLRKMNAFPVKRDKSDRTALRKAEEIIKSGGIIGIFPEGRVNLEIGAPKRAKAGVGFIAGRCQCPVVPVCLYNEKKGKLFTKLTVRYGKPLSVEELELDTGKKDYQKTADIIMDKITELWREGHA